MTDGKKLISAETVYIPLNKLSVVWVQSQRPLDEKLAQKIAAEFDPDIFGQLSVSKPNSDGMHHIIDGQTRKRGAEIYVDGDMTQQVPCRILNAANPVRAAQLFDKINSNRRTSSPIDFYRVRVTAQDEDHVTVDAIVHDNGYFVGGNSSESNKGLSCVSTLLFIKRRHGAETLDLTLKVIHASWGFDKGAQVGPIVQGVGMFLATYRSEANWQQIIASLRKRFTPGQLILHARNHRDMHGGTLATAIKGLMVAAYNRGFRGKQLEETAADDETIIIKTTKKSAKAAKAAKDAEDAETANAAL